MNTVFLTALLSVLFHGLVSSASSAEVENVAVRGKATQCSLFSYYGNALNAIDGNSNTNYYSGTCAHTKYEYGPWWRVDLLDRYKISRIAITSSNYRQRQLSGAELRIGDSLLNNGNDNPRCAQIQSIASRKRVEFTCSGMTGRYVNVVVPSQRTIISLCEVEVFGELVSKKRNCWFGK
nr:PREDICTED: fucolectin-like [Latimeria chalumnae]|eukprot:XP_006013130.1 PREDICTED: fucolectin-like [Latimeria chalumnae]